MDWLNEARAAINRSEVFVVMLGPETQAAPGVLKEVKLASELRKLRFQIIGYINGSENWAVPNAGCVYKWDWGTLKKLLG